MESTPIASRNTSSRFLPWLLLFLVVSAFGLYLSWDRITLFFVTQRVDTPSVSLPSPAPVQTLTAPGVLRRIQQQNKLETVSFKITTIVTATREGSWYKLKQDAQKAIYIVDGTVTAGIDLSKLSPEDVTILQDGKVVEIKMPPAEVFHTNLEPIQTYDHNTGLFGIVNPDPALMEQAQRDARVRLGATACESDILVVATENGRDSVARLFSMLDVEVTVIPKLPSNCNAALLGQ